VSRCGFAALLGRPNVGKSTLLNALVGEKVSITSPTPHTTRHVVRGIQTEGDTQVVIVDTPGLHRPRTALGTRLNDAARSVTDDLDCACAIVDATADIGAGDRQVLETVALASSRRTDMATVVVVNKVDRASRPRTAQQLATAQATIEQIAGAAAAARVEYFPVSARTGEGVGTLLAFVRAAMPDGPFLFPDEEVSDIDEYHWIAELVREQLIRRTREELPHSIHCRVTDYEWPHITVQILVERESQKGMVIGKKGALLKEVGIAARAQMPEGVFLELSVAVEPGWQRRPDSLDRLGF
jgi:GTP-binding protein Era